MSTVYGCVIGFNCPVTVKFHAKPSGTVVAACPTNTDCKYICFVSPGNYDVTVDGKPVTPSPVAVYLPVQHYCFTKAGDRVMAAFAAEQEEPAATECLGSLPAGAILYKPSDITGNEELPDGYESMLIIGKNKNGKAMGLIVCPEEGTQGPPAGLARPAGPENQSEYGGPEEAS